MSVNKVILLGNLGKDPETFPITNGTMTKLRLATSRKFKDEEKTEWHTVVAFGKLAETCSKYLSKGRQIYVEGRLQTRKWEDKEGRARYETEVLAEIIQFINNQNRNDDNIKNENDLDNVPF
jgi:single-strand DNA-binding protein